MFSLAVSALAAAFLCACGDGSDRQQAEQANGAPNLGEEAAQIAKPVENAASSVPVPPSTDEAAQARMPDGNADDAKVPMQPIADLSTSTPLGFARNVTGGGTAKPVIVKTREELKNALCSSMGTVNGAQVCTDDTKRVIEISSVIDFRDPANKILIESCYNSACIPANPLYRERVGFPPDMNPSLIVEARKQCVGGSAPLSEYDKAGAQKEQLVVGSNKTLIGVGLEGAIKGKGLQLRGARNVIIRNLTFSDINEGLVWGGDAINLIQADGVWIDHNRFTGIGRQMLVTGDGQGSGVSNLTVSWNDFQGKTKYSTSCDNTHYWGMLLVGHNDSITFINNWMRNFGGRQPKLGGKNQILHLANNYFVNETSAGHAHALDTSETNTALVEGNYFKNIWTPITKPVKTATHPGPAEILAPVGEKMAQDIQANCEAILKRPCVPNKIENGNPAMTGTYQMDTTPVLKTISTVIDNIMMPHDVSRVANLVENNAGPRDLPQ